MKSWFDIIEPHRDIKEERFSESIFAADLGDVILRTAPPEYNDPYIFAKNTFFTEGISNLLQQVSKKLTKGEGPGVIEIQTPFGGGKTHALISIYHYIRNNKVIRDFLPKGLKSLEASIGVIVGTHLNPVEGRTIDGITLHTLWGELAYQLGGKTGYQEFQENDKQRISPGKEKLKAFLAQKQPFILLFDEILEYIARALDATSLEGNLGGQTYAFLQELTETVASIENGMLVVSLPSSVLEDYTGEKEQGLARLNKIFGRIETIETPVRGDEVYSIIRKRLFQELKDPSTKQGIIHRYYDFYRNHPQDIPPKAKSPEFNQKIDIAYPFHPDTIDLLYEKWGTFSSFQRTRGVLRLLANVIGDLYQSQKNIDMILPCEINLNNSGIRREFIKHIGYEYESIIGSDIAGHQAKAQLLDRQNPSWRNLAQRISTSVFLHSFTAEETEKGINIPYIKMAVMRPETIPAMITEILQSRLTGAQGVLWYLNERDGRFYFSKIPSIRKILRDKKELINDVDDEIESSIRNESGKSLTCYVWPASSSDIPDNKNIKLILTSPEFKVSDIEKWLDKKRDNFRIYKNNLIFAIPDTVAYSHLEEQMKELLALNELKGEIESGEWKTLDGKLSEVVTEIDKLDDNISYNVRKIYNTVYVGKDRIDLGMPSAAKETLSLWIERELTYNEKLVKNLHYNLILRTFLTERNQLETKTILEQFYKNTNLPMLDDENVLKRAIKKAVSDGELALAIIEDGNIMESRFRYNQDILTDDVTFIDTEYIIVKEKVKELICQQCGTLLVKGKCPHICLNCGTHLVRGVCPVCDISDLEKTHCQICGALLIDGKCPNICEECSEHLVDGICPNICSNCGSHLINGTCPTCGEEKGEYTKINLKIENISANKLADLHRGVLMPISREIGDFNFNIEIDITNMEGIERTIIDKTIKDVVNQLGAKITKEELR